MVHRRLVRRRPRRPLRLHRPRHLPNPPPVEAPLRARRHDRLQPHPLSRSLLPLRHRPGIKA